MNRDYAQLLDKIPNSVVEGYLHSAGTLLHLQERNAPMQLLTNQQTVVGHRQDTLRKELERREIVVPYTELVSYLINRGIGMHRERQTEAQKTLGGRTPEEALQITDIEDVRGFMEIVYPLMEKETFRLLLENMLRDDFNYK